ESSDPYEKLGEGLENYGRATRRLMTAQELLNANGIYLKSYDPGEHSTTCPECSAGRKLANQKKECLSVKIDDQGATWFCHNCKRKGPQKGQRTTTSRTADDRPEPTPSGAPIPPEEFLEKLRPSGPWIPTAIVPDGTTTTLTAHTADQIKAFIRKH